MDEVTARDPSGELVVALGERPDSAVAEDDVIVGHGNLRKGQLQRLQDVILFLRLAPHPFDAVDPDIGRAGQHLAEIGKHDANPAIDVLEKHHVSAKRLVQRWIVQNDMRALGAGNQGFGRFLIAGKFPDCLVQPGTRGVDDGLAVYRKPFAGLRVGHRKPGSLHPDFAIVHRNALRREPHRIDHQFDTKALGIADPGIVIGGRKLQASGQVRPAPECLVPSLETVPGQKPAPARHEVVKNQADLDRQCTTARRLAAQAQEPGGAVQEAGEDRRYRNDRGKRSHEVRSVVQQRIAFPERFLDKIELAVFEIAKPTMDHP